MNIDELDIKVLEENFDIDTINSLDAENVSYIYKYLLDNGVYYAKDLFMSSLDLFLLSKEKFIKKFEKLKIILGSDYVNKLGEDSSLIEIMYED